MSAQDKKNKSIAEAVRAIHKQFGSGSIMRLDGSEVQQVEYYIVTDAEASDRRAGLLVRTVDRNLLAATREKPPEEVLLPGIESMEVSFYDGDSWKDSWEVTEDDATVPQAIRVRLQPAGGLAREQKPAPIEVLEPWTIPTS